MARFSAVRTPGTSKGFIATPGGAIRAAALATAVLGAAAPCWAADVTADRLINADREPENWLMAERRAMNRWKRSRSSFAIGENPLLEIKCQRHQSVEFYAGAGQPLDNLPHRR
jgi:hypothetical protein